MSTSNSKKRKSSVSISRRRKKTKWTAPPFHIKNLDDLITFAWEYKGDNVNTLKLWRLINPLTELKKMVGMQKLKDDIIYLVMYYAQELHKKKDENGKYVIDEQDMLHTILCGSPGCGKTVTAHILAKIYSRLGFLKTDNVIVAKRCDFIGRYVGHSEHKTKQLLENALGGVLFIDEAYSMGCNDKTDSYSKAAIDLLNQYLTEHKNDFVCIIAGYEEELDNSFFNINKGLRRRFPWKFKIDDYTPKEMSDIFHSIVQRSEWKTVKDAAGAKFFDVRKKEFPFYGGDIEVFFGKCKLSHTQRIFGTIDKSIMRLLTIEDIDNGYELYLKHKKTKSEEFEAHNYMFL